MKKILSVLILSALSTFALANGEHASEHGMGEAHHHHGMHDSAVGKPGDLNKVDRTIEVTMDDHMRFTPDQISVKPDETIRFNVKNTGKLRHEMVIGSMAELKEHAKMMLENPNMKHSDPNAVSVAPGQSGTLVWQFGEPGTVDFACLEPGHMEAGMKGQIEVK